MAKNLLVLLLSVSLVFSTITEDEGVWVLTEANFEEALAQQPDILVEFYAPWCGHCKSLAPEYAKAAKRLLNSEPAIHIAKVDATENSNLAQKYGVQGYPTLKYFVGGEPTEYTGGRTEDSIYSYVIKKSRPSVTVLEAGCNLEKLLSENKVNVLLFGQSGSHEAEVFEKVAKAVDGVNFFLATSSELATKYDAREGQVVLLKEFDERRNNFEGALETEALKEFVNKNKVASVIEFDQQAIEMIFRDSNPVIFMFTDKYEEYEETFGRLAKEHKGSLLFCKADLFTTDNGRLSQFLGMTGDLQPTALILDVPKQMGKFRFQGSPTYEELNKFIEDWKQGSLSAFLKSQEIPAESHDNNVRVLVAKNFKEVVFDSKKDVLVEFYAPWCGHCKSLAPEYERLATELKNVKTLVIAKMDSTENEVDGVDIQGFPTLKFYPANNKKPLDFEGDRNFDGLLKFIKQNSYYEVELTAKTDL
jgi:protein disulfide-isomerase A1